jgi:hypothetical protein
VWSTIYFNRVFNGFIIYHYRYLFWIIIKIPIQSTIYVFHICVIIDIRVYILIFFIDLNYNFIISTTIGNKMIDLFLNNFAIYRNIWNFIPNMLKLLLQSLIYCLRIRQINTRIHRRHITHHQWDITHLLIIIATSHTTAKCTSYLLILMYI